MAVWLSWATQPILSLPVSRVPSLLFLDHQLDANKLTLLLTVMGQGANMAIVDGYVAATRLSAAMKGVTGITVEQALLDYDCKVRRKENNDVIKKARNYGKWAASKNRLPCLAMKVCEAL